MATVTVTQAFCFEGYTSKGRFGQYPRKGEKQTRSRSREGVNVCPHPLCTCKKKRGSSKSKKRLSRKKEKRKLRGVFYLSALDLSPDAMHREHTQEFFAIQRDRKYGKGFVVRKKGEKKRRRGRKLDASSLVQNMDSTSIFCQLRLCSFSFASSSINLF